MDGLLDFIKTPEGQGLLSAAFGGLAGARKGTPFNNVGRAGLAGLSGYGSAQDRIAQEAEAAQARELRAMQTAKYKRDITADEAALAEKQRIDSLVKNAFLPVSGTDANARTGITGPRPEAAQAIGTKPAVDFQQLIAMGVPFDLVKQLAESQNLGRTKVARTVKGMGEDGREFEYQVDEFGQRVGDGLAQYRAPLQVNQGDRQTFVDAYNLKPVGQFGINETPDGRAGRAVTMRGQNMTDARARERLAFDAGGGADGGGASQAEMIKMLGKPAQGYRWKPDGTQEVIPGGPADQSAGAPGQQRVSDANAVMDILRQAEPLLEKSTSSYAGAGMDQIARVVGIGTSGANASAQLKALEGALISKMPKMSGPQSDKDVLLYKQMAGQIGDATLPVSTRKAAMETIREMNSKYSTVSNSGGGATAGWEPSGKSSSMSNNGWSAKEKR